MLQVQGAHLTLGSGSAAHEVLSGVDVSVAPGEIVSIIGENGCGKSSLASLLCAGRLCSAGRVVVNGIDPAASEATRLEVRRLVGLVRQNPQDQIVSSTVADEVAFGPRNLGFEAPEVKARVAHALEAVGLSGFEARDTNALSGGEQQRLALAGVLAMEPAYLVLDEATSMLDSTSRDALRQLLMKLAREKHIGVIQITHEAIELLQSDRIISLESGRIAWEGTPRGLLLSKTPISGNPMQGSALCEGLKAAIRLGYPEDAVLTPQVVLSWLENAYVRGDLLEHELQTLIDAFSVHANAPLTNEACLPGIEAQSVSYSYRDGAQVLKALDFAAPTSSVTLLAGCSGCGKSTLLTLLAGLSAPDTGRIAVVGQPPAPGACGMAFQRPENQLFLNSVYDEIALGPCCEGCTEQEVERRVRKASELIGLDESLYQRFPFELSGGQARRVALASILALEAQAYLFDEPTAGLDSRGRKDMHRLVRTLAARGLPVVVVSHDLEEWLSVVDTVVLMADGRVVWSGSAQEVVSSVEVFEHAGMTAPFNCRISHRLCELREDIHAR